MALRRLSLPIIFAALLLFSLVLARELDETPTADQKAADLNVNHGSPYYGFDDNKQYGYGGRGGFGGGGFGPRYGYGHGGYRPGFGGYGRGGYGGRCFRCRFGRCCSAEEYAEFVQGGN